MPRSRLALALLLAALPAADLGAQPGGDALAARVDSVAERVLAATGVPSASVAVVRGGRVLRAWTFETPDGKLEQYQIAPVG